MILRHEREQIANLPAENTFEAIDERSGNAIARCRIYAHRNDELFPARPLRIYMDIQGNPVPDALLGAAVARAKGVAQNSGLPCRIFAQVEPDDEDRMSALSALGFKDNDGLVCMRRETAYAEDIQLPISCVEVQDDLDDPIEQKFFLERYNQLFNEDNDFDWLQDFCSREGFMRILIVAPNGMAGETVIWKEDGVGKIGWLFVSRKWRGYGVSRCLLELACRALAKQKIAVAEAEIQARIPGMLHVMEGAAFRQAELILRYPGIDIG